MLGTERESVIKATEDSFSPPIREVLMQCAVCCGVPAVREAVRCAQQVFAAEKKKYAGRRPLRGGPSVGNY